MLNLVSNNVFSYGEPNPLSKEIHCWGKVKSHTIGIAGAVRGKIDFVY